MITEAVRQRVAHPGPVNLAFGNRCSLLEVVSELEKILDRRLPLRHQPARPGDVPRQPGRSDPGSLPVPGRVPDGVPYRASSDGRVVQSQRAEPTFVTFHRVASVRAHATSGEVAR